MKLSLGEITQLKTDYLQIKIAGLDRDITPEEIEEVIYFFDQQEGNPKKVLVDTSEPHSVSFEALMKMGQAKNVKAVALFAPGRLSQGMAHYVEKFQNEIALSPFPFRSFPKLKEAIDWLDSID